MARKKKNSYRLGNKSVKWWASLIVTVILLLMQQMGKPLTKTGEVEQSAIFRDVSVASVYDGDTIKINLNCSASVYCEKVPVRVRGVDTPEIKGKFLANTPINLSDCGRDKYFRLLCHVTNGKGQSLAKELIKADLGYAYEGGRKSSKYQ